MRSMVDLESAIRNPFARPHFHEAVLAYQSGAYGAAIIEAWVAVALDLTEKIRLSVEGGNNQAKKFVDGLDDAISKQDILRLQRIETELLDQTKALGIVSNHECVMLDRLKKDRNCCAHPSFISEDEIFVPNEELARMHLSTAIDCCLALPSAPGKKVMEYYQECVDSFSWPAESSELAAFLRSRFFNRVRESTKRQLMELIIKQAIEPPSSDELSVTSSQMYAFRCRCAINVIYKSEESLVKDCMRNVLRKKRDSHKLDEDTLLRCVGVFGHITFFWITLEDDEVLRVKALLDNRKASVLDSQVDVFRAGPGASSLVDLDVFASGVPQDDRIASSFRDALSRLGKDQFGISAAMERSTYHGDELISFALESLKKSSKFVASECVLKGLQSVSRDLCKDDILELGKSAADNDQVYLAPRAPAYIENLCHESSETQEKMQAWHTAARMINDAYTRGCTSHDVGSSPYQRLADMTA